MVAEPVHPTPARAHVEAAIRRAADATGVDFSLLVETAQRESALNPQARAATSSATGLFQFIESTWLDMVRRHGPAHGLGAEAAAIGARDGRAFVADPQTRADILALRNDPEIAARMAGELARDNAETLRRSLGRAPSAGELYAAHVLGAGGAARLIAAAGEGAPDASALFPREAGANRGLFYAGGAPVSAQSLLDRLSNEAVRGAASPAGGGYYAGLTRAPDAGAALSPALAHALFAMALMPLLRREEEPAQDHPLAGLAAYARWSGGA
ncbi:MAG: transglycosylase SLT domain-containing protein [Hyphomonadaceae bacterium]